MEKVRRIATLKGPPFTERSFASIARATGMSPAHITKIMRGDRRPSLDVAARIAEVRRITLDDLYRELEDIRALVGGDAVLVDQDAA